MRHYGLGGGPQRSVPRVTGEDTVSSPSTFEKVLVAVCRLDNVVWARNPVCLTACDPIRYIPTQRAPREETDHGDQTFPPA